MAPPTDTRTSDALASLGLVIKPGKKGKHASAALPIETALTLPVEEQRHRVRAMRTHLGANTVHDWAEGFFRHLDEVHPRGQRG